LSRSGAFAILAQAITLGGRVSRHPPKPRLALAVGVIGHRPNRLPEAVRGTVAAQIGAVMDAIALAAGAAQADAADAEYYTAQAPLLSIVNALAEGADRMAAEAALARGYVLDVPLPFAPETYEQDFAGEESRAAFRALLKRARSVLVLPGRREAAPRAYEAAGLVLLGQSDLLLAVWDGEAGAGRGGTTELLAAAARRGLPIIHVDAKGLVAPRLLWSGGEPAQGVQAVEDLPSQGLEAALALLVLRLLRPPDEPAERAALRRFLRERPARRNWRLEFPALLACLRLRPVRRSDLHPPTPEALATGFAAATTPAAPLDPGSPLAGAYGWADAVGTYFAQVFRGAYVVNFVLAALAVVVAALSLLFSAKAPFVSIEIALILLVIVNTTVGRWLQWHRRWLEGRELAERLRVALPLWVLGLRPAAFTGEEPAWTGWYARAIVRQQGPRAGTLDAAGLQAARAVLAAVLTEQAAYHRANAERMRRAALRLEGAGAVLVAVTLLVGLRELASVYLGEGIDPYVVTAISAALPAIATATYGIRIIGDFEGIAARSRRTGERLDELAVKVGADPLELGLIGARARAAADIMLGDVSSWRLAAESRVLAIPG
jgi:hypothetical protein